MGRYGSYDEEPRVAEYYDLIPLYAQRADVHFYVEYARQASGKVLELGCGTGRILIPIAAAGREIVGLDLSEQLLAKCRAKLHREPRLVQERVRLMRANMTDFNLGETFSLVTLPFRPLQHLLTVEEQLGCLTGAHRHLANGGKLVLDVFQPDLRRLHDPIYQQETEEIPETELSDGRRFRLSSRVLAYRRAEQVNEVELIFNITHADGQRERFVEQFPLRYFFRYEVEHLLVRAGFRVVELFGNFDKSSLRDDSPEMIFVGEKSA